MNQPTPGQIKQVRAQAGLTQSRAAELCCVTLKGYQHWEYALRKMPESTWELFQIKCGRHRVATPVHSQTVN